MNCYMCFGRVDPAQNFSVRNSDGESKFVCGRCVTLTAILEQLKTLVKQHKEVPHGRHIGSRFQVTDVNPKVGGSGTNKANQTIEKNPSEKGQT